MSRHDRTPAGDALNEALTTLNVSNGAFRAVADATRGRLLREVP